MVQFQITALLFCKKIYIFFTNLIMLVGVYIASEQLFGVLPAILGVHCFHLIHILILH